MNSVITFKDISFKYDTEFVLKNISFKIHKNDFIGLIGPNGGGKTTILKLMLGLLKPFGGSIEIFNQTPQKARAKIGYLPQYSRLDDTFPITVEEVVAMGLFKNFSLFPFIKNKSEIKAALKQVSMDQLAKKQYGSLSGGQKQRCLIARALVSKPEILLLDEPTSSVDSRVEQDIYELLKELNKKMTIILVSHDLGFVSKYIKRIFCINKNIACHKTNEVSIDEIINEAYEGKVSMISHECNL